MVYWVPRMDSDGIWRLDPDASVLYDGRPLRDGRSLPRDQRWHDNRIMYAVKPELEHLWTFREIGALLGSTDVKVRVAYYEWSGKQPEVIDGYQRLPTLDAIYGVYDIAHRQFRRASDSVMLKRIISRMEANYERRHLREMHKDAIRILVED